MFKKVARKLKMALLIFSEVFTRHRDRKLVHSTADTLKVIKYEKKSLARFGDGEFDLALGKNIGLQTSDPELIKRLRGILKRPNNGNCLVAIPHAFSSLRGLTWESKLFWVKYFAEKRKRIRKLLIRDEYWDSQVSRLYINRSNKNSSIRYFDEWKDIWSNQRLLVVEGENSRFGVGNNLFDSAKSVKRILCPNENAFSYYNEIYRKIMTQKDIDLVILVLGATATVMAFDLSTQGIWALDCGNMDLEFEWMNKGVKKKVALDDRFSIEVKGDTISKSSQDKKYLKQVVSKIGS